MCILDVGQGSLEALQSRISIGLVQALFPEAPVVIVSDNESARETRLACEAGIRGFIPAAMEPSVFFAALDLILRGGTYIPHSKPLCDPTETEPQPGARESGDARDTSEDAHEPASDPCTGSAMPTPTRLAAVERPVGPNGVITSFPVGAALSARQEEVLTGIRAGKSNKAIARDLDLSEATVKIHVRQLLRKLGVSNRTQIALISANKEKFAGECADMESDMAPLLWTRRGAFGVLASN
jgi:two-component system, NarL family, nitrate/nitrite response regulator NarL